MATRSKIADTFGLRSEPRSILELKFLLVVACLLFSINISECYLTGMRFTDFPLPDFRSRTFSLSSQARRNSFKSISHGFNSVPFFVRVYASSREGDSAGYRFEAVGTVQNSGYRGNYGGLMFAYNSKEIRLWAPTEYLGNSNGRVIFVGDGWGGERYTQSSYSADVTVEAWKYGPNPNFQTEIEVDIQKKTFYEIPHKLNQIPDMILVRVSSNSDRSGDSTFYFHAVGAAQNPPNIRQYGGIVFSYNETTVRLWLPDPAKSKKNNNVKTGCIMVAKGWGGGQYSAPMQSMKCHVQIRIWINTFSAPVFQTEWKEIRANAHQKSFREINHGLNKLPLYVQLQVRPFGRSLIKSNGHIFEGMGSIQSTQFSKAKYGGVTFAYNEQKVRIWVPSSQRGDQGRVVLVSKGWGNDTNIQDFDTALIRVRIFAHMCPNQTQAVDGQGICREASQTALTWEVSSWKKCSSVCGSGIQNRSVTGCYGKTMTSIVKCDFQNGMCGFARPAASPLKSLNWVRTRGSIGSINRKRTFEPPYGYPKGSYFIFTDTSGKKDGWQGILESPLFPAKRGCVLRFFYNTGVYYEKLQVYVSRIGSNSKEVVWEMQDRQPGNKDAWIPAYVNIGDLVKEPIKQFGFIHLLPSTCGVSCVYNYVALDNVNLECLTDDKKLMPIDVCHTKEITLPGCPVDGLDPFMKGPAFSTETVMYRKDGRSRDPTLLTSSKVIKANGNSSDLIAAYIFRVRKKANYSLWMEGYAKTFDDNTIEVQVDRLRPIRWNLKVRSGTPLWNLLFFKDFELDVGEHKVYLHQIEKDFKYRKLVLSPKSLRTWTSLGMQNHQISDLLLTSPREQLIGETGETGYSRLNGIGVWNPSEGNKGFIHLQIHLTDLAIIYKIATQGGLTENNVACQTEQYKIKVSIDGKNFAYYRDSSGNEKVFKGNTDASTVVTHTLSHAVPAKSIRFYPWLFDGFPCMRVEVYGIYMTDGMCEHVGLKPDLQRTCIGNRKCEPNAECQTVESRTDGGPNETCQCVSGFHGNSCQYSGCSPNPCKNGGTCHIFERKFKCACPSGYFGRYCHIPCPPDKFGPGCSQTCSCLGHSYCHPITAVCKCNKGYTGTNCDQRCPHGTYGKNCTQHCQCSTSTICDHVTGECYCPIGFYGYNCSLPCSADFYGRNCSKRCKCSHKTSCLPNNGTCVCSAGWTGRSCSQPCPTNKYGFNCLKSCSCPENARCDNVDGQCICKSGWTGKNCVDKCPAKKYGSNCRYDCQCDWQNTKSCDRATGQCACMDGYTSPTCSKTCGNRMYGANCSQPCQCINNGFCHPVTGNCQCQIGYIGKYCEHACADGKYGRGCRYTCKCVSNQTEICDRYGTCHCRPGYRGRKCHRTCRHGTWGRGCENRCYCSNGGKCESQNGFCTCASGWQGTICLEACDEGTYGPGCKTKCKCKNGAKCNRFDGSCKCAAGYYGKICDKECLPWTYGESCKNTCICDKKGTRDCSPVNGVCNCLLGYKGSRCESVCRDGFYGNQCKDKCFPCRHVTGPCDKRFGYCSCSPGLEGDYCFKTCDLNHYGHQCESICDCPSGKICNNVDGSCFDRKETEFFLAFKHDYRDLQSSTRIRDIRIILEELMEMYYDTAITRKSNEKTKARQIVISQSSQSKNRTKRELDSAYSHFRSLTRAVDSFLVSHLRHIRDTKGTGSKNITSFKPPVHRYRFIARILQINDKVDNQGSSVTQFSMILLDKGKPVNAKNVYYVLESSMSTDTISNKFGYTYYNGKVYDRQVPKEYKYNTDLQWIIIAGSVGGTVLLIAIIILTIVYRRRSQPMSPVYRVKKKDINLELRPCLGRGRVIAFDNPYYDVIAAMGLDDDIEEDYYNPLYTLYDGSSFYGDDQRSDSDTDVPHDDGYLYPYDRDSGISSGTI